MNKEAKVLIGLGLLCTIGVIVGALLLGKNPSPSAPLPSGNQSLIREDSPKIGSDSAKVKIVEFADYQCPGCKVAFPAVEKVIEEFSKDILFVYRFLPIPGHKNAKNAAYAALSAGEQGKYWEMHKKLFEGQDEWESSDKASEVFIKYAKELGLDEEKFKSNLQNQSFIDKVDTDEAEAYALKVSSTPTFFINGTKYAEVFTYDRLKKLVEEELKK